MVDVNNVQNTVPNSAPMNQSPEEVPGNKNKIIIGVVVVILVCVIAGAALFYLYSRKAQLPPPPQIDQVEEVRAEVRDLSYRQINPDSTTETVFAYIDTLNTSLEDPSINQTERMTLLLKKARALASVRAGALRTETAGAAGMIEALGILESLYMITPENETQSRIRAGVIPIYLHLLVSSCFISRTAQNLPGGYDDTYTNLTSDPTFPPKAATILALRKFGYDALPTEYANDIVTVMWRDYVSALYLYAYADSMTGSENDAREEEIRSALYDDIYRYGELEPLLVSGTIKTEIEPLLYTAFAFDIATTFNNPSVTDKRKEEIGVKYEDALLAANTIEGDETSKAALKIGIAMHYLDSLYRLYGDNVDQKKVDQLIDIYIENFNHNKDTRAVFTSNLIEGLDADGIWMPVRTHFYEIAKKNPKLRTFIAEKTGINL